MDIKELIADINKSNYRNELQIKDIEWLTYDVRTIKIEIAL